ncbi:sensor histidine kinase [Gracilibacillus kekensis]|uniref:HAMP domain-containing protein n=1 Tax=Gracilibacillus kekensis TaxID=1027249 RepID=A0A1M7JIV8_9BACI|nr:histidine kinase [Gracilibacillus kekensis]SHM52895.1 HAMP domain-containing protein [Gracilibacillus kekensis]
MIRKLKTIMVICFVFVNALFLAAVSYTSYQYFFNFTSNEISETKLSLLNESANKLSGVIKNISEAGTFVAIDRTVAEVFDDVETNPYDALVERNKLKNLINNVASLKQEVYSIELFTDRYQEYSYLYDHTIQPESHLTKREWFAPFIKNVDNGWVPRHTDALMDREMISYVHRILNQRNQTVGYIKVNILAEHFLEYLNDTDLYQEINEPFILLNTGGRIIAETHSREEFPIVNDITVRTKNEIYERLIPKYDEKTNHHQLIKRDNEYHLLLISKPNYEQWRLVQVIPVDNLYAETKELGIFVLVVGFIAILLSIPIVYGIGKWITKPISQMIKGMRKVEKGDFDVQMNRHYVEEYDIMANNFNQMTGELAELLEKLDIENSNRREAEMRALQSQIMPHFLYNTLDMIKWKSLDHDADEVSDMVNKLSKMLRIGLSGGLKFIRLRDELDHAKCYIDIQKQRQAQDIQYKVRVAASMKDLYVPKIILQPFIENSIKHGYHSDQPGQMEITVNGSILEDERHIKLTIKDNGSGLPENWTFSDAKGIGIQNVRERIAMYCGEEFDVKLFNHLEGGVMVEIILPIYHHQPFRKASSIEAGD